MKREKIKIKTGTKLEKERASSCVVVRKEKGIVEIASWGFFLPSRQMSGQKKTKKQESENSNKKGEIITESETT
jgi:hypothetical protein